MAARPKAKAKTKAKAKAKATSKTKPTTKPAKASRTAKAPIKHGPRADFGKPIDTFFRKQPAPLRAVLVELRTLVEATAPDATSSIKWGMPFYELGGTMFVALGAHKSHVNLILAGPPGAFEDPRGRLTGEAKMGRHLKLTSVADLPRREVKAWLATAARLARTK